jgi:hypothetical protein
MDGARSILTRLQENALVPEGSFLKASYIPSAAKAGDQIRLRTYGLKPVPFNAGDRKFQSWSPYPFKLKPVSFNAGDRKFQS